MKQSQGFSLISMMIVLTIGASAFVLVGKTYKTYQTNKDVMIITEFVRTLKTIVEDSNSGNLLYQVDPDSVSTHKNIPPRFAFNSSTNLFEDPNGTTVSVDLISPSMVSFFSQLSAQNQGFMITLEFDANVDGTARCSKLINSLINDFKIIGTRSTVIRNNDSLQAVGNACATPVATFISY